jgi:uncharacterized phosphosugar-binding protein
MTRYFDATRDLLARVAMEQADALQAAVDLVAPSLLGGGIWHLFGTGHSHLAAEELYFRAGGLAPVNAILFPALMQHEGPVTSTRLERLPGLAGIILDRAGVLPGEVLTIISNSGRNAVPVEMASLARERGIRTIGITSRAHALAAPPSPLVGSYLHDEVDVVLDNGGVPGDAALPVGNSGLCVGPTSSLINIALLQQIVADVCERFVAAGVEPPVFKSANLPGGDAWNVDLIARYGGRVNLR